MLPRFAADRERDNWDFAMERTKKELQGPRPAPLKICRESHGIRKPPLQYRPPVVIYTHSPKVIHTEAREFMTLVQRLTGRACKKDNNRDLQPPRPDFPPRSAENANDCRSLEISTTIPMPRREESSPSSFPPWSPNFLVPSPRLLSPNVFQDFPLFTPHPELFHSPMLPPPPSHLHHLHLHQQRPATANAFSSSSVPSPSPTGFDLFNNFLPEF